MQEFKSSNPSDNTWTRQQSDIPKTYETVTFPVDVTLPLARHNKSPQKRLSIIDSARNRMKLGDAFPDFAAETNRGRIGSFYQWIGEDNWAILFSHPADFTPVCTTELARAAILADQFASRKVRMIALSCDSVETHKDWIHDICAYAKGSGADIKAEDFPYEIIADEGRQLANLLGMLDPLEMGRDGIPLTARAVYIIGPKKTLRSMILYPATTGRDFGEILRVIDSLQLTDKHPVATPEGWTPRSSCMVQPSLSEEDASKHFGDSVKQKSLPSGKPYLRFVDQP